MLLSRKMSDGQAEILRLVADSNVGDLIIIRKPPRGKTDKDGVTA